MIKGLKDLLDSKITLIAIAFFTFFSLLSFQEKLNSKVLTAAVFTEGIEGPSVDKKGDLYLVNFNHEGSIGIIKKGIKAPKLFIDLPKGSIGNGIRFNAKNEMFVADYLGHNILKIDITTKKISVHAHDSLMNQPNDLTMMKNGIIFCSDPSWKKGNGKLWRVDVDGSTHLLSDSMGTTNGIEVSPDNKTLYVNESVQRNIWKFDVDSLGNISNKQLLISFTDGGMDGMRCDSAGNIFVARCDKACVLKISAEGKILYTFTLHGLKPTNVAFSRDEKKLFVTMQDKKWVEVIRLK